MLASDQIRETSLPYRPATTADEVRRGVTAAQLLVQAGDLKTAYSLVDACGTMAKRLAAYRMLVESAESVIRARRTDNWLAYQAAALSFVHRRDGARACRAEARRPGPGPRVEAPSEHDSEPKCCTSLANSPHNPGSLTPAVKDVRPAPLEGGGATVRQWSRRPLPSRISHCRRPARPSIRPDRLCRPPFHDPLSDFERRDCDATRTTVAQAEQHRCRRRELPPTLADFSHPKEAHGQGRGGDVSRSCCAPRAEGFETERSARPAPERRRSPSRGDR